MTSPAPGETLKIWIERHYAEESGLRERVAELVAKMELEQDLAALRETRGLSMGERRHR